MIVRKLVYDILGYSTLRLVFERTTFLVFDGCVIFWFKLIILNSNTNDQLITSA